MNKSFKLFTVLNLPIEINYSWFIILALVIYTLACGYFPASNPGLPALAYWLLATISAFLLFTSLLAHELSHSYIAIKNHLPISRITLFIFGGVAHMEDEPSNPTLELKMAIAGPLMSFFLALFFYALTQAFYNLQLSPAILSTTNYLFVVNLFVGIFNLVPGFPLDGGRILRALLWKYYNNIKKATSIATSLGKGVAFFLIAIGLLNFLTGSFLSGVWFVFLGLFLQEAADISYKQIAMKNILSGVRVENLMTKNVVTVPSDITLNNLVDNYFFRFRFNSFPVIENDQLVGIITLHDVKEIERADWAQTSTKEVMSPIAKELTIDKETDAFHALAKMAKNKYGRLLVIDGFKLIGILSQRDILRLFEFKSEIEE